MVGQYFGGAIEHCSLGMAEKGDYGWDFEPVPDRRLPSCKEDLKAVELVAVQLESADRPPTSLVACQFRSESIYQALVLRT